jgi:hypothetical protein
MIASWMLYAVVLGLAVSAVAAAAEYALRLYGRSTRWLWATSLVTLLVVPMLAWSLAPVPAAPALQPLADPVLVVDADRVLAAKAPRGDLRAPGPPGLVLRAARAAHATGADRAICSPRAARPSEIRQPRLSPSTAGDLCAPGAHNPPLALPGPARVAD